MNIAVTQSLVQRAHSGPIDLLETLRHGREQPLGRLGSLTVRLARTKQEVRTARELRQHVFFASGPDSVSCEADSFDDHCDHLLVLDDSIHPAARDRIVGTYRLLRQGSAIQAGGYCSQNEFDVQSLIFRHPYRHFLELSRSCVLPEYRSKRTAELLWQGIWAYCRMHAIDVMFGCASFPGIVPARHALPLSFLYHHARAAGEWAVEPMSKLAVPADLVPAEAVNLRPALAAMPPLVKGYLRLGAKFSGSAVVDPHFGTTDVLVILRTEDISDRYLNHYGHEANRFA
jgi:L-ornithine Nalpha-acyltransferase